MKQPLQQIVIAAPFLFATQISQAQNNPLFIGLDTAFTTSFTNDPIREDFTVTSETNTIAAGRAYLGARITPNIQLEIGMARRTKYNQKANNSLISYDADVKTYNKDVILTYHLTEGIPGLFLLTGMVWTKHDINATTKAFGMQSKLSTTVNYRHYALGLGYEAPINDNLHWRVAYTRYGAGKTAIVGLKYVFGKQ
jgi:hypothetical protein